MVKLAEKYDTKCVVSKEWYKWICLADYFPNWFTDTESYDSFLFGKSWDCFKDDLRNLDEEENAILMVSGRGVGKIKRKFYFTVGYSSHSNSKELEEFVSSIRPKKIAFHSNPDTDGAMAFMKKLVDNYC